MSTPFATGAGSWISSLKHATGGAQSSALCEGGALFGGPRRQTSTGPSAAKMAGGGGGAVPKIIDINTLLEQYAFAHFCDLESVRKHKSEFRGIDQDDVEFEVNWRHLHTLHEDPDYCNLNPTSAKPFTLFKSVFRNNTARPQEYSFKTERSTESVCLHFKEQGYSLGQEAEFSLKTPGEVMEFKAGFKHEMNFSKGTENSIAEMLTWGVDSNIVVPPKFQTTAELIVEEMSYAGSYTLVTRLAGRVTVTLVRRKDGAVITVITANICEVFRDWMEGGAASRDLKTMVTIERNAVRLVTKGTCSFQFAMKQKVELHEEALDGAAELPRHDLPTKLPSHFARASDQYGHGRFSAPLNRIADS